MKSSFILILILMTVMMSQVWAVDSNKNKIYGRSNQTIKNSSSLNTENSKPKSRLLKRDAGDKQQKKNQQEYYGSHQVYKILENTISKETFDISSKELKNIDKTTEVQIVDRKELIDELGNTSRIRGKLDKNKGWITLKDFTTKPVKIYAEPINGAKFQLPKSMKMIKNDDSLIDIPVNGESFHIFENRKSVRYTLKPLENLKYDITLYSNRDLEYADLANIKMTKDFKFQYTDTREYTFDSDENNIYQEFTCTSESCKDLNIKSLKLVYNKFESESKNKIQTKKITGKVELEKKENLENKVNVRLMSILSIFGQKDLELFMTKEINPGQNFEFEIPYESDINDYLLEVKLNGFTCKINDENVFICKRTKITGRVEAPEQADQQFTVQLISPDYILKESKMIERGQDFDFEIPYEDDINKYSLKAKLDGFTCKLKNDNVFKCKQTKITGRVEIREQTDSKVRVRLISSDGVHKEIKMIERGQDFDFEITYEADINKYSLKAELDGFCCEQDDKNVFTCETICAICHTNDKKLRTKLSCGHDFHHECMKCWVNTPDYYDYGDKDIICPVCRNTISINEWNEHETQYNEKTK